ncbi:MAG TPA: hypothetical protein DCG88_20595 [Sphingobacterium sp.]|nr:hypothetical protein [Sphingobacterium sp.]
MIKFAHLEHLDGIIKLWEKNRSTLGLMPKDAFRDNIQKKWILVSCNKGNEVEAYLQFRHTNRTQTISIVHLCVSADYRGKNLAKKLLDELVSLYQNKVVGIKLSCRSDYKDAIKFWQKYNFQPKAERPSRGKDPNVKLVTWWFSFGKSDLFSAIPSDKVSAILDFNIISKLRDIHINSQTFPEVEILTSDWIADEIEFEITSETVGEIFRDSNKVRSLQSKQYIKHFKELNLNKNDINNIVNELMEIFSGKTENDISDRRQLAEAILSNTSYFLTLDDEILKKGKLLNDKYGLKVSLPINFILELDELKNASNYYPAQLSAENFSVNNLSSRDHEKLNCFILTNEENRKDLDRKINKIQNKNGEILVVKNSEFYISLIGHYIDNQSLIVELLRLTKHRLSQTVLFQNIFDIITYASLKNLSFISIKDLAIHSFDHRMFEQFGFFLREGNLIKALSNKVVKVNELPSLLTPIYHSIPELEKVIQNDSNSSIVLGDIWRYYFLEKKLWPLKIDSNDIMTFIIPIKPRYARELFDTKSAKQTLFGASPKLIWNNENVYYRSVKPNIETLPARILWYASSDNQSNRQKCIVGTSYLDEIIVGPAKELFNKYKKYGIYDWNKHIKPMTNGDENKEIKILKFSHSEVLQNTIPYKQLLEILKAANQAHNNFVSPVKIKSQIFADIYRIAKGIE